MQNILSNVLTCTIDAVSHNVPTVDKVGVYDV